MRLSTARFIVGAVLAAISGAAWAQTGPYKYTAIPSCRLYDSRAGQPSALGTGGGAMTTTLLDTTGFRLLRARGGCGVPATAQAITLVHTALNSTAPVGLLSRMCPNPLGGGQTICRAFVVMPAGDTSNANGGVMTLGVVANPGSDSDFQIQGIAADATGYRGVFTYDWAVDVTGYFR
jgi:hypothetical protein